MEVIEILFILTCIVAEFVRDTWPYILGAFLVSINILIWIVVNIVGVKGVAKEKIGLPHVIIEKKTEKS
ncbi:hypothetical protein [Peribacillus asahii]|uniref:hypothetical protein n=1 Tax=Peribacillus asahii TaxID=228899 RepID=UPI00207A962F|nr:hypothetical protein [Peribacillus asahii]USK62322.1 hypothetical protein LIT37_24420 [Peribacillus asahii]